MDVVAGGVEFLGDLAPWLARSNDEHGASMAFAVCCPSAHEANVCAADSRTARHILTVMRLTVKINERYSFHLKFTRPVASIKRP